MCNKDNDRIGELRASIKKFNEDHQPKNQDAKEEGDASNLIDKLNEFIYGDGELRKEMNERALKMVEAMEAKNQAELEFYNAQGNYESGYAIPKKYKELVEQYKTQVSLLTRDSAIFKEELEFTHYQKNELYEAVIMDYWHNVKKKHPDQSDSYFLDAFSTQGSCRDFITPDGCSWSDGDEGIETLIMISILNLCGCGTPDEVLKVVLKVLQAHDEVSGYSERIEFLEENNISQFCYEYIAHDITEKGLMEHGSSVYGSWLTDLGKCVLHDLKKLLNK